MRRRKRARPARIVSAAGILPWWGWSALAVAAYLGLHALAASDVSAILLSGTLGRFVDPAHGRVIVATGQYLLPLVFLALAALSAYGRRRFPGASGFTLMAPRPSILQAMSAQQFELLLGEAFRRKGYALVDKGGRGRRNDLMLQKAGERCLVSVRQWRAIRVGMNTVHELAAAMADRGAARGIIVTTGTFTPEAAGLARASRIELMDGAALGELTRGVSVPAKVFRDPLSILTRGTPYCPECQGRMVKKRPRQGPAAGTGYWRCIRYPDCKGKRPL